MKFFGFLTKYSTRILLAGLLILLIAISVGSFNKSFDKKTSSIMDIASAENVKLKIDSYPAADDRGVAFTATTLNAKDKRLKGLKFSVFISGYKERELVPGDILSISGKLYHGSQKLNCGGFEQIEYNKSRGVHATLNCMKLKDVKFIKKSTSHFMPAMCRLRNRFTEKADKMLKSRYAGIIKALVTGDKTAIPSDDAENLRRSGVYHIVAISGLHLNIFIMAFTYFIASLRLKRSKKAILSAVICTAAGGFVLVFTGFGTSVLRAFVMLVISLASALFSRRYSAKNSLFMATCIILICMPESFYGLGFRLSVLSTLGVLLCADVIKLMKDNKKLEKLASFGVTATTVTSLICALVTLPVIIDSFGYLPVYSFLANIIILPLMAPALGGAIIFGIVSICGMNSVAALIAYPLTGIIHIILSVCKIIVSLPVSSINLYPAYTLYVLTAASCFIALVYFIHKNKKLTAIIISIFFVVAAGSVFVYNKTTDNAKVTFFYSGQGECALVSLPGGKNIMMDYGTADYTSYVTSEIDLSLVKHNIRSLDALFISHFHEDHISGALNLIKSGRVKNVLIPWYYDKTDNEVSKNYRRILEASIESGTPIHHIKSDSLVQFGDGIRFDVISPKEGMILDANNMSAVVKFSYGSVSFLFTGDIAKDAMSYLYDENIECDVLKVPHHGSKSSADTDFINLANPEYAVVSYGINNSYGHPHKNVIKILKEKNIKIYKTGECGEITFSFDKNKIKSIKTMR